MHLEVQIFREDQIVLIAPDSHPLAARRSMKLSEALEYDFVGLVENASLNRVVSEAAASIDSPFKIAGSGPSFDGILQNGRRWNGTGHRAGTGGTSEFTTDEN